MSDSDRAGLASDPSAASSPTASDGCCSSAPTPVLTLTEPTAGPCCGTSAEATAEGSCCGSHAKADAVAAGQSCCG
jgi:hypothetical protein